MYTNSVTDTELSYRLLLSLHSIIAVSVYPFLINSWAESVVFSIRALLVVSLRERLTNTPAASMA
jgi:hypothetical protein